MEQKYRTVSYSNVNIFRFRKLRKRRCRVTYCKKKRRQTTSQNLTRWREENVVLKKYILRNAEPKSKKWFGSKSEREIESLKLVWWSEPAVRRCQRRRRVVKQRAAERDRRWRREWRRRPRRWGSGGGWNGWSCGEGKRSSEKKARGGSVRRRQQEKGRVAITKCSSRILL